MEYFYPAATRESTYLGTGFLVDLAGLELTAGMGAGCSETNEGSEETESVTEEAGPDEGTEAVEGVDSGPALVVEFVIGSGLRPSLGLSAEWAPSLKCATLHVRQL